MTAVDFNGQAIYSHKGEPPHEGLIYLTASWCKQGAVPIARVILINQL